MADEILSQYVIEYIPPTLVEAKVAQYVVEYIPVIPIPMLMSQYVIEYIPVGSGPNPPVVGSPGCPLGFIDEVAGRNGCPSTI